MKGDTMYDTNNNSINVTCNHCGSVTNILVDVDDYLEWQSGTGRYIQDIFDYLSAAERELMISQTCGSCWNNLYPNDLDMKE
jgi:hypothetical protein